MTFKHKLPPIKIDVETTRDSRTCNGCRYRLRDSSLAGMKDCRFPQQPAPCTPRYRDDGRSVIFLHSEVFLVDK